MHGYFSLTLMCWFIILKLFFFYNLSINTESLLTFPTLPLWPDQWQHTLPNLKPNTEYSLLLLADNVPRNSVEIREIISVRTDYGEFNGFILLYVNTVRHVIIPVWEPQVVLENELEGKVSVVVVCATCMFLYLAVTLRVCVYLICLYVAMC